jgi:hypothetical protein
LILLNANQKRSINRFVPVLFLPFFILACFGCHQTDKGNIIIPEKTFKKMLIDIHMLDGYYMMNYGRYTYHNDSNNFYKQVFKRYGYSRLQFDSTVHYYTAHLDKFDKLYENLITDLNKMNQEFSLLHFSLGDTARNLYKGKKAFLIQKDSISNRMPFDILLKDTGLYQVYVQLKVYPDDQSQNLHLTAYFFSMNTSFIEKPIYFDKVVYTKEMYSKVFSVRERLRIKKYNHLKGFLLDEDTPNRRLRRHVDIRAVLIKKG